MFFAIVQDADRSENAPFAVCSATKAEVAEKICKHMHLVYDMPAHIATLDEAHAWFSGEVEDGDPFYEEGVGYNAVWEWNTDVMHNAV
jgi:hypothetical protein